MYANRKWQTTPDVAINQSFYLLHPPEVHHHITKVLHWQNNSRCRLNDGTTSAGVVQSISQHLEIVAEKFSSIFFVSVVHQVTRTLCQSVTMVAQHLRCWPTFNPALFIILRRPCYIIYFQWAIMTEHSSCLHRRKKRERKNLRITSTRKSISGKYLFVKRVSIKRCRVNQLWVNKPFSYESWCASFINFLLTVANMVNSFSVGTDFRRQNLTSIDVRFRRLKSIPALKIWKYL